MTKLKTIIEAKCLKQKALAKLLGMNYLTFNGIVNGRIKLKLDTAKKIADILNVEISELV